MKIVAHELSGSVSGIALAILQIYKRIECENVAELPDSRFEFFVSEVLPQLQSCPLTGILIFIPNYFDFVRLRNYFMKESLSFAEISEYTSRSNVSRARSHFYNGKKRFLLYTERYHFYNRVRVGGVQHIIFYQLPYYGEFYSEIVNTIEAGQARGKVQGDLRNSGDSTSCTVLYSPFDAYVLERVLGTSRCKKLLSGSPSERAFMTDP
jgi:U3 small nucleolar RNA-associated protein 25